MKTSFIRQISHEIRTPLNILSGFVQVITTPDIKLDKDEKEAFKYYKNSADNGFARAQVEVSKCYSLGLGVKADEKEAVKYLQMAVEQGDLMAKYILGIMYYRGLDIEKNVDKAIELLGQAAREGHRGAQVACEEIKCYKK